MQVSETAMSRPLGERQISCLRSMDIDSKGIWHSGCGWLWDTYSGTVAIMESLARRGLVEKREGKSTLLGLPITYYQITAAGRAAVARPAK